MLLADLVADVRPDVPGCPEFSIRSALQRACVEFLYESGCWLSQLDPIALVAGRREYDLALPDGAMFLRVNNDGDTRGVRYSAGRADSVSEKSIFERDQNSTGSPQYVAVRSEDDTLIVWPTPTSEQAGQTITLLVVLGAQRTVTEIPDTLGDRWRDALVCRAKARLMNTTGKPWSNPTQGAYEMRCFWDYVNNAKREALTSRYAQPQRVVMRPLA